MWILADVLIWVSADGSTADVYVRKYEFIFNDLFLSFVITVVTHWQPPYSNFWEDHKTIIIRDTTYNFPKCQQETSLSQTSQRYEFAISIKLDVSYRHLTVADPMR